MNSLLPKTKKLRILVKELKEKQKRKQKQKNKYIDRIFPHWSEIGWKATLGCGDGDFRIVSVVQSAQILTFDVRGKTVCFMWKNRCFNERNEQGLVHDEGWKIMESPSSEQWNINFFENQCLIVEFSSGFIVFYCLDFHVSKTK